MYNLTNNQSIYFLSLVIPTYNEAGNIQDLIVNIEHTLKDLNFEIIIVDDNSPDGTGKAAENLNNKYGNIRVFRRLGKLGLSSAVTYGFKKSKGSILAVMDADFQHPPETLKKMYDVVPDYDIVVASRNVNGGASLGLSTYRKIVSKIAGLLAYVLLPKTRAVKDRMSGCFMLKRDVLNETALDPLGYKILLEILVKGHYQKVAEVPYVFRPRNHGASNLNNREILNYLRHIGKLLKSEQYKSR